ncbi:MAG: response regulator [Herpetosiphon sp.]
MTDRVLAKIVVCEDDPTIQKLINVALRAMPYVVYIVENGLRGLEVIERELPHVVFTDVSMPEMDGVQLLDALKARPALAHIPVVFMTASVDTAQMEEAYQHGAIAVIHKPFSITDFRALVSNFMPAPAQ